MQLFKHQEETLEFLKDKPCAGIFLQMGLGKSLVILEHLKRLKAEGRNPFPCLIVGPLSGVSVWNSEVEKFGYGFKVHELVGTLTQRTTLLDKPADIYVINYEGMRIMRRKLNLTSFRTFVLDESHRIKNRGSQQTRAAIEIAQQTPFRYLLTGTPVTKSPEDIWSQFYIIKPSHLGNFFAFCAKYIAYKKIRIRVKGMMKEIRKAVKYKNLDELRMLTRQLSIRRTKDECLDLPKKIYKVINYYFTPEQSRHYESLKKYLRTMLDEECFQVKSATAVIQKLQQVCQGFLYDKEKNYKTFDCGKQKVLFDLLQDLEKEKVIIFTWFQADMKILYEKLQKKWKGRIVKYGGKLDERKAFEHEFQTCSEPCIFIAQVETAKESITLTAASHVIYYGCPWSYATRKQSEDRAHRIGQDKNVIYYDLVCRGAVDSLVLRALKRKDKIADNITGDTKRLAELLTKGE